VFINRSLISSKLGTALGVYKKNQGTGNPRITRLIFILFHVSASYAILSDKAVPRNRVVFGGASQGLQRISEPMTV